MSEEEIKAIEYWKDYMSVLHWNTQLASEHYMKILLDLIEKLQKENKELKDYINRLDKLNAEDFYFKHEAIPKSKIEKIVYQLEQDEVNITKKYKEGKGLNCYLSAIDRVRIRAYRTKTKEIKERIQKLLEND